MAPTTKKYPYRARWQKFHTHKRCDAYARKTGKPARPQALAAKHAHFTSLQTDILSAACRAKEPVITDFLRRSANPTHPVTHPSYRSSSAVQLLIGIRKSPPK